MKKLIGDELIKKLESSFVRKCYTSHECCLCLNDISLHQLYYDGGYGKRAHITCVDYFKGV